MTLIAKILSSVFVFGLIIFIHEFGHFIVGVKMGVKCNEFSLGMGPRLFTIHGKLTDYSLKLLPIGGSCALKGELEDEDGADDCFVNKKPWQRFLVIFAGPAFNIILSFLAAIILIAATGQDLSYVSSVSENYPAAEAGIEPGDRIVKINNRHIFLYRDVQLDMMVNGDEDMDITVDRNGEYLTFHITPKYSEEAGRKLIGITGGGLVKAENIFETISYAYHEVRFCVVSVFDSIKYICDGHSVKDNVMGVVGVVSTISNNVEQVLPYGLVKLLLMLSEYIIMFGTNIAIMNLLPFPALDGGRLFLIIVEMITGRKLSDKVEGIINYVGFGLLMLLTVFIMINDITKLM